MGSQIRISPSELAEANHDPPSSSLVSWTAASPRTSPVACTHQRDRLAVHPGQRRPPHAASGKPATAARSFHVDPGHLPVGHAATTAAARPKATPGGSISGKTLVLARGKPHLGWSHDRGTRHVDGPTVSQLVGEPHGPGYHRSSSSSRLLSASVGAKSLENHPRHAFNTGATRHDHFTS